jgi:hypothetical protein
MLMVSYAGISKGLCIQEYNPREKAQHHSNSGLVPHSFALLYFAVSAVVASLLMFCVSSSHFQGQDVQCINCLLLCGYLSI